MKPIPDGYTRIASNIYYEDPVAVMDWLCEAFGFEIRLKIQSPDGELQHSELVYGDGMIMVGDAAKVREFKSPRSVDGVNTQTLHVYVDDVDEHCKQARAAGAKIHIEPGDRDYGNRVYLAEDIQGHRWWFSEPMNA
ncbi:MAG: VOC family protein [Gammaproteobacteria bacterium]|nr:VOC family protein [Gammaproteobacteria bacterium]